MQDLYFRLRNNGMSATRAYVEAKNRFAAGVKWYSIPARGAIQYNPVNDSGTRWIEHAAQGLRFTGFADKLANIQHTGWFTREEGGETLRGVVYQMPARNGKPQFIPGYIESDNYDETGGACLDFSNICECERKAAYAADRMAERVAESEREYNSAWRAGSDYAEAGEALHTERKATLQLIAAIKAERKRGAAQVICDALRSQVQMHVEAIAELREKRNELLERFNGSYQRDIWPAFNDGAGANVLQ